MAKSAISGQNPAIRYWYQKGVVPIPIRQRKRGTSTDQSGIGTHSLEKGCTGTDQSGTGTDASSKPYFCTLALLSPKFVH